MNCVDVDSNTFDKNEYSKYNKLVEQENKIWNQNLINERLQNQGLQTLVQDFQKPIVEAIDKQTKLLEDDVTFIPFILKLNVNKKTFNIQKWVPEIKEITFEKYGPVKKINQGDLELLLTKNKEDDDVYISNIKIGIKYLLNDNLKKCLEGNAFDEDGNLIVDLENVKNYLKLIGESKANDYFKQLHALVEGKPPIYKKKNRQSNEQSTADAPKVLDQRSDRGSSPSSESRDMLETGEGLNSDIIFLPDNPCELFYQLSKLLAAKKAGHNNTYNQVNAICKRLMELKLISNEKYRNILKKYLL